MNRIISSILLLLLTHIAFSQEYKHIAMEFNPDDYSISGSVQGQVYIQSSRQEGVYLSDTNLPAIPYKIVNVKVWGHQEYAGVTLTQSIRHFADNVVLRHNPVSLPTNAIPSSSAPDTITYSQRIYPDQNVIYTGTSDYGDYRILSFLVSPWVYDARERKLELMTRMNLQIELSTNPLFTASSRRDDYSLNEFTNALAVNADEFANRLQPAGLRTLGSSDYEYVVITTNALSQYFLPLVRWKTQKGVKAKIITMEDITTTYPDSTIQLSIKRCLHDYYTNHALKYVLLGGDDTIVPVQGCYCYTNTTTDYHIPCDNFYACFSGHFAWNADGDSITGEYSDNPDFTPFIYISRAPIRSANDVTAFVNKTLNYEKTPNVNGWNNNMLMGGQIIDSILTEYNPPKSDSQAKGENLYNYYIQPYWTYNMLEFYDTYTDLNGGNYYFSSSHLQDQLAEGYTFVDLITHGDTTLWTTSSSDYTISNASSLTNPRPTIITTTACTTNAFDSPADPCLSEAFIRNPNSNVIAYLGCSRVSFEVAGSELGPSLIFEGNYYKRLFGNTLVNKNWGYIVANAKAYIANILNNMGNFRWVQFGLNPIGDPEMPVFINPPVAFEQSAISYTNSGFTVNAGVSGCRICIMSSDDNGASVYNVYDNVQTATVDNFNCNLSVCITKQGYIPKVYNLASTVSYIQNVTITTDTDYVAGRVNVGTNVTSQIPSGNVVIQNCDVTIAADETTLYPTTEVKARASLTITNR